MINLKRTNDLIILKSRNFKLQSETYVKQIWAREMLKLLMTSSLKDHAITLKRYKSISERSVFN